MTSSAPLSLRYIELFADIGGFRIAADRLGMTCVFASDIDEPCQRAYAANFGDTLYGDITQIPPHSIPHHDILVGGFPCQPFSIIGQRRGFADIRGTLFFTVATILAKKRPHAFVLENVKQLAGHNGGKTLQKIMDTLHALGYAAEYRVLNALDFGLPQKRERIFIVGRRANTLGVDWEFPILPMTPLSNILENNVDDRYFASKRIAKKRHAQHRSAYKPAIWHENKSGNVTSYPYSCTLRAGASYNYLLVDGKRRLTPREMLRLQGFPDTFKIVTGDYQARKQAGNAVPVPMVEAVLRKLIDAIQRSPERGRRSQSKKQLVWNRG